MALQQKKQTNYDFVIKNLLAGGKHQLLSLYSIKSYKVVDLCIDDVVI